MSEQYFQNRDGYYIHCFAMQLQEGGWAASATFESAADFEAEKTFVRGVRHRINSPYPTKREAMEAASMMVDDLIERGAVNLPTD